ncbi:TIGR03503 family protein [Catenovulum adriaticum]|uniref:TIGR03503 family protein n=1 Tax=Catenovulum adriaticum TaxID=2984846 RepID=A0ABY7AN10_9ALTE|nr:TIGR03503 family protein [Catenovulum sp. TS8]WAJ70948.1 TIGR03503 family protein [Catenovulum sp. TS8]
MAKIILSIKTYVLLAFICSTSLAQSPPIINSKPILDSDEIEQQTANQTLGPMDVIRLVDAPDHLSSIQLIQNRFRIDEHVDDIVMVFFRKYGSAPLILIRPDGSKLYAPTIEQVEGQWYDDLTFDMIQLKKPMVGPWQVVGNITPDSKIMVLSDVQLKAEPLPSLLFSGEIIKLTASLLNGGKPIQYANFSDVVQLDVTFLSTNNNEYQNFAADSVKVAQFKDDGQGFDERRKDSVFTGEFKLNVASGEWVPSLFLDLGLFNRELLLDPVILHPVPFDVQVDTALDDNELHSLNISANTELINFSSFAFSGEIFYPTGESQRFSIPEEETDKKQFMLFNYGAGTYKVKLSAFGKNKNGRDMMIHIPEYSFNIAASTPVVADTPDLEAQLAEQIMQPVPEPAEPKMSATSIMLIIVGCNLVIFILAFILIKYGFLAKTPFWKQIPVAKLKFWSKKKSQNKNETKQENQLMDDFSSESDDIIDLTLPEET